MKISEFVKKYNGKKVDFDKAFGCQCVDLFRQYCNDVLGIPHTGTVEGAKDLYLNYALLPGEMNHFTRIATRFPRVGDVVIWDKTPSNKYGHVAICIGNLADEIIVFEQNGFAQDGAKIVTREKNILGVLRYKGELNV